MGVAREMGRLIRLSYNGHLPAEELTRYVFALDKLRGCLESAIEIEAAAAERAKAAAEAQDTCGLIAINVIEVPAGLYRQADGSYQPLTTIEHMPALEEKPSTTEEPTCP